MTYKILEDENEMPSLVNVQQKLKVKYSDGEISEAYDEIISLNEQGMLFSTEESLEDAVNSKQMNTGLKALC
jgi:uncharacterized protein